jgi:hypothetical protein
MTDYLVHAEDYPDSPRVLFFSAQHGLTGTERLIAYLKEILQVNHACGMGPLIRGIWRVALDEEEKLQEVELRYAGKYPEMENICEKYYLTRSPGSLHGRIASFEIIYGR